MICTNCIYFKKATLRQTGGKAVTINCDMNLIKGNYKIDALPLVTECNRFIKVEPKLPQTDTTTG
jgi:hypothetical protein